MLAPVGRPWTSWRASQGPSRGSSPGFCCSLVACPLEERCCEQKGNNAALAVTGCGECCSHRWPRDLGENACKQRG